MGLCRCKSYQAVELCNQQTNSQVVYAISDESKTTKLRVRVSEVEERNSSSQCFSSIPVFNTSGATWSALFAFQEIIYKY
jgi:hypothetical protein